MDLKREIFRLSSSAPVWPGSPLRWAVLACGAGPGGFHVADPPECSPESRMARTSASWVLDTRTAKKKGPGGPGPEVLQKDMSESSPSWTVWPMPSPALRALALHSLSQGINVLKWIAAAMPTLSGRCGQYLFEQECLRKPFGETH